MPRPKSRKGACTCAKRRLVCPSAPLRMVEYRGKRPAKYYGRLATTRKAGTSMSAPHAAGVVALMWDQEDDTTGGTLAPEDARSTRYAARPTGLLPPRWTHPPAATLLTANAKVS